MFSIEERVSDDQRTSRCSTNAAKPFVGLAPADFWDDLNAPALERRFWVRNEPYILSNLRNLLIPQQMRTPSERTINPRFALKFLAFFPDVTRGCYHAVHGTRSCRGAVRVDTCASIDFRGFKFECCLHQRRECRDSIGNATARSPNLASS